MADHDMKIEIMDEISDKFETASGFKPTTTKKIKDILKRDLWWDAKTCLKYGLVDDIITP